MTNHLRPEPRLPIRLPRARRLLALLAPLVLILTTLFGLADAEAQSNWRSRKGRKYTVSINSYPQQAAIYLEDKSFGIVGYTPWRGKLAKGDYRLIIELQGYKPSSQFITVGPRSKSFRADLEKLPQPGTIDVQAVADPNMAGAQVFLNGQSKGSVPAAVEVPAGRYLLEIKKSGFQDYSQWVDVKEAQRVMIAPVLKATSKPKGSLLVDADVPDAEVIVDGERQKDATPTLVDGLDEGAHSIEVRKPGATPWKQTVYVKAGERTKVTAQLSSSLGGSIRVISNVDDAEVHLDGEKKGNVPLDLRDIPPGWHIVEVRAKGYVSKEERVNVVGGQSTILKLSLEKADTSGGLAKLKVVSQVPDARVVIDGAVVGTAPIEKDLPPGEHFVSVEKEGFKKYEQKVTLAGGTAQTVQAELRAVGALRFLSNLPGAEVVIDGEPVGRTPMVKEDIEIGDHVVTIRQPGYFDFEQNVKVEGGKLGIVNAELRLIDTGPTADDIEEMRRGLSSFGAKTIPFGHFTADVFAGYPYVLNARATVGVKDLPEGRGWDMGVGFRSYLTTWEFLIHSRFKFYDRTPFSFAGFGQIGGGSGFDGRNEFTLQMGGVASLQFANLVTISGRAFLDIWSDRLCGEPEQGSATGLPSGGPDVCTGKASPTEMMRAAGLVGKASVTPQDLQARDSGTRGYLSLAVEVSAAENFGVFGIVEGAPFQDERAAFTDTFNQQLFAEDPIYNLYGGVSLKF